MDCRAFGSVEHLGLDKGLINVFAHLTAQGIDFSHQMSLGGSSDMGIAGHHSNAVHIHRENDRAISKPGAGKRRFTAGMSGTDHTYVSVNKVIH